MVLTSGVRGRQQTNPVSYRLHRERKYWLSAGVPRRALARVGARGMTYRAIKKHLNISGAGGRTAADRRATRANDVRLAHLCGLREGASSVNGGRGGSLRISIITFCVCAHSRYHIAHLSARSLSFGGNVPGRRDSPAATALRADALVLEQRGKHQRVFFARASIIRLRHNISAINDNGAWRQRGRDAAKASGASSRRHRQAPHQRIRRGIRHQQKPARILGCVFEKAAWHWTAGGGSGWPACCVGFPRCVFSWRTPRLTSHLEQSPYRDSEENLAGGWKKAAASEACESGGW